MRPLREKRGALLAHFTSALGTHTVAAALKRATPCERLVSGSTLNEITSCQATSRSSGALFRLRKSVRRVQARFERVRVGERLHFELDNVVSSDARSEFSLFRLRKSFIVLGDALSNACRTDTLI